jgi:hypothetical protein
VAKKALLLPLSKRSRLVLFIHPTSQTIPDAKPQDPFFCLFALGLKAPVALLLLSF